jgi:hypothetical protein
MFLNSPKELFIENFLGWIPKELNLPNFHKLSGQKKIGADGCRNPFKSIIRFLIMRLVFTTYWVELDKRCDTGG